IPSMWKLYRGLKNMSSTTEENESSSPSPIKDSHPSMSAMKTKKEKSVTMESLEDQPTQQPPKKAGGQSVPKLYV
ncbi:YqfQ family protein, partial [Mycobacterium tuberculosis]|nr:YqfQ family protein [Mycobacterium tuberculosis]